MKCSAVRKDFWCLTNKVNQIEQSLDSDYCLLMDASSSDQHQSCDTLIRCENISRDRGWDSSAPLLFADGADCHQELPGGPLSCAHLYCLPTHARTLRGESRDQFLS